MDETVLQKIPHRPPFLFVDKIVERTEDGLTAERVWDPSCAFYEGHYPGNPLTPGVLLCESVFQTAGIFLADRIPEDSDAVPVLTRIHSARFKRIVRPGERVTMNVKLSEIMEGRFFTLRGTVRDSAGKMVLLIDFTVAMLGELPH